MNAQEERSVIRRTLAKNRYAECPANVSKRRFSAIRHSMEELYMKEWMRTPQGLYTDSEIWKQTFIHLLKKQ